MANSLHSRSCNGGFSTLFDEEQQSTRWMDIVLPIPKLRPSLSVRGINPARDRDSKFAEEPPTKKSKVMTSRPHQVVNLHEFKLYEVTNKAFIISGLRQIYDNSLEHGVSLWSTEQNCPYSKTSLWFQNCSVREDSSAFVPTSLYQRACQLDKALAHLRTRPLTAAEDAGSARSLKLAVMAFASRWSRAPVTSLHVENPFHTGESTLENVVSQEEMSESNDFEHLLQQSLYTAAMTSIQRWSKCDSFRMILAQILVFFIKRPPDENDVVEIQNLWAERKRCGHFQAEPGAASEINKSTHYPESRATCSDPLTAADNFTTSQSFRNLMRSDSREVHVGNALRHLLAWGPKIRCYIRQAFLRHINDNEGSSNLELAKQVLSNFNIMFWLAIMCDTAGSALDQRALTVSDQDAEIQLFNSERFDADGEADNKDEVFNQSKLEINGNTVAPKLWGRFLMLSNEPCENPYLYRGDDLVESAKRILREASPLKILLLRKVCQLQALMKEKASPGAIEQCISDALQVCTYWNMRFGEFFQNSISQHRSIPFSIRSWYVMLLGHWYLGYLQVANCIEQCDKQLTCTTIQAQLRRASSLVQQLQREGAFTISTLARVSCEDVENNVYDKSNQVYHDACRDSSMLTDPCGDCMFLALSTSCDTFFSWMRTLQLPPDSSQPGNIWLHRNIDLREVLDNYVVCIQALKLFGRQYDVAKLTAKFFEERINLLGMNDLTSHRNYIRRNFDAIRAC
ncbi:uncharacterized protein PV09_01900 [Verruconis gallopava]|uniref:Uncharacterized protein n=1 Tax=Verruconis gallopava TaxID=253628 RepID=A0A0D2AKD7_9PEZI|nr:uncharacterized protein PV09_01900 [Verruconis gallopava]KIW07005.1 hypothetical protein PV09_01900 [Verruconis gallopava]